MQYTMKVDQPTPEDQIFITDGVSIIVDETSLGYLRGCRVDYVDSLNDSGFKIENPNATRNCGCGTSFEPRGTNEPALVPEFGLFTELFTIFSFQNYWNKVND